MTFAARLRERALEARGVGSQSPWAVELSPDEADALAGVLEALEKAAPQLERIERQIDLEAEWVVRDDEEDQIRPLRAALDRLNACVPTRPPGP